MKSVALILTLIMAQQSFSQTYYLIAGTYTKPKKSEGIYTYAFDANTGDTKLVSTTYTVNPSYLALSKDRAHIYAVNENGDDKGAVSSFSFNASTGKLQPIGTSHLSHGDDPCFVGIDATGKWAAVANYTGGSLSIFPVQADGSLGEAAQTITHTGTGPDKERQEKAHVHSTVFTPDNKYLAVADLGIDKIMLYPFDASQAKPLKEQAAVVNTPPASGPRHIIFHPSKPYAYLLCELSGTVIAYHYENGKLGELQKLSSHPADFKGDVGSAAIHFSPDGKFLYASNRGVSNSIAIYSVDGAGKLKSVGFQPTGGDHPRDFTIDPSGNFLLVGNMHSDNIRIFKRDKATGLLTDSGKKIDILQPTVLMFTQIK